MQISDTHLTGDGAPVHGLVDTAAALETALARVTASGAEVDALLFTGDLAQNGEPGAYRRLRALAEPAAAALGATPIYAMGNHDERGAFAAELLGTSGDRPLDAVHDLGGLRVVVLDSTTPGRHEGRLEDEQLAWLEAELATPAPEGTVVVVHHPPLRSPVPTVDLLRLHDSARLGEALAGSDARIVLTGHAHHTGCGAIGGVPVWISPAIVYRVDPLPPRGRLRATTGAGITRVDLMDGTFVATAIDLAADQAIYEYEEAARVRLTREAVG